jgi:hypothetical protein
MSVLQSVSFADSDHDPRGFEQIIGRSPALESVREQVRRGAPIFHSAHPWRDWHRERVDSPQHSVRRTESNSETVRPIYASGSLEKGGHGDGKSGYV